MNENIVQWTLLQNLDYLSSVLNFPIALKKGQEITTDYGRIDFILENHQQHQIIVELETTLDTKNKRDYCLNQILNYKNVKFTDNTHYCILYANETNLKAKNILNDFGTEHNILIKTYSINYVKDLYTHTVERLNLSFGLSMPKPANYTICYLRWLNKILKPFRDFNKNELSTNEISSYFTSSNTTNFRCYLRLALDFEMITQQNNSFKLTNNGIEYIQNYNPNIDLIRNLPSVELTNEQKKIILRVITNGNWTPHKVNIYLVSSFFRSYQWRMDTEC